MGTTAKRSIQKKFKLKVLHLPTIVEEDYRREKEVTSS